VFHRVVRNAIVQGGGLDRQLRARATLSLVANESRNGLHNVRGTVAAARTNDPDSASAQFFVNLADNTALDAAGRVPGYTVFARVKDGLAVFDEVSRLPAGAAGPFSGEVPTPLVAIRSIARLDEAALAAFPAADRETAIGSAIAVAAAANDTAATLRLVDHYRAICGASDPEVSLAEARAALAGDDRRRALFALEELLATTATSHSAYAIASALREETLAAPAGPPPSGGCEAPAAPALPDATSASEADMVAAQGRVRAFVTAGETYLACLAKIIDDEKRAATERNTAVSEHNRMVAELEQTVTAFNERIRAFRARGG
jgi:cyclophilin family peptidyl-prolyl cis-trans isomerase